jgi:hypothetical protein
VLGELTHRSLDRHRRAVLAGRGLLVLLVLLAVACAGQVDLFVGDVDFAEGKGGVDEDDVAGQVQQVAGAVDAYTLQQNLIP